MPRRRPREQRLTAITHTEAPVDIGENRTVEVIELQGPARQPPLARISLLDVGGWVEGAHVMAAGCGICSTSS